MGKWTDVVPWVGPIRNSGDGDGTPGEPEDRMSGHVGVVIHTAEGSYSGTDTWQRNPAAEVGSHFLTARDGRGEQLIDTDDRSWCQSAGNSTWISIENEGYGSRGESLSPQQVETCARILAKAHVVYGVPLQVSNSPSTPGLGWHGMGAASWGGHNDCPGDAIRAQFPAIVARAAQITSGTAAGGDDFMGALTDDQQRLMYRALVGEFTADHSILGQVYDRLASSPGWGLAALAAKMDADAVRDKAMQATIDGLLAALKAGGGSVDAAPIVAAVTAVRDEARQEYAKLHGENAKLQAQLAAYESREAAAARAEADMLGETDPVS